MGDDAPYLSGSWASCYVWLQKSRTEVTDTGQGVQAEESITSDICNIVDITATNTSAENVHEQ